MASLRFVAALFGPSLDGCSGSLDAYSDSLDQMARAIKAAEDPTAGSAFTGSTSSAGGPLAPVLNASAGSAGTGSQDTH
jgi:hypothetical protein